jgi:nicotinate dehydrogenase subunit A
MTGLELEVNGRRHLVTANPGTPLLTVLRNDLGLKGAKFGCGLEQCYACAVIADGELVTSCATAVEAFAGRRITTVEGIGSPESLDPVQRAFVAETAAQCGYCTAGLVVGARALLDRNPDPTDREIREALDPHLCRCGSHVRVIRAVKRAAKG